VNVVGITLILLWLSGLSIIWPDTNFSFELPRSQPKLAGPDTDTCTGACARTWPPFIARRARPTHPDYKVIRRPDGRAQWSFRGRPLYYVIGDRAPGQVKATDANSSAIDPDLALQRTAER